MYPWSLAPLLNLNVFELFGNVRLATSWQATQYNGEPLWAGRTPRLEEDGGCICDDSGSWLLHWLCSSYRL